jgi:hypothetical protein
MGWAFWREPYLKRDLEKCITLVEQDREHNSLLENGELTRVPINCPIVLDIQMGFSNLLVMTPISELKS